MKTEVEKDLAWTIEHKLWKGEEALYTENLRRLCSQAEKQEAEDASREEVVATFEEFLETMPWTLSRGKQEKPIASLEEAAQALGFPPVMLERVRTPYRSLCREGMTEDRVDLDHAWDHLEGLVEVLASLVDLNKEEKLFHHLEELAYALGFPSSVLKKLGKIT